MKPGETILPVQSMISAPAGGLISGSICEILLSVINNEWLRRGTTYSFGSRDGTRMVAFWSRM